MVYCKKTEVDSAMDEKLTAFLGCGNMGGALARAAAQRTNNILLTSRTGERAEALAAELGVRSGTNRAAAETADTLFLGVKPQMMAELAAEIAPVLAQRTDRYLLVSMAAGVPIAEIRRLFGAAGPVIRILPNTPAAVGQGMILWCADGAAEEEKVRFLDLLGAAGEFDALEEKYIDVGGTVSGCTPAFVFQFIEALADGGVACGLPRAKAQRYAAQAVLGSAELLLRSGAHPGGSPGGSTIQGVRALEDGAMRGAVMEAVIAAFEKTRELGR
jgi:pyrroline-5-carboxylate reductase